MPALVAALFAAALQPAAARRRGAADGGGDNVTVSITMPPGTSLARTDALVQQLIPIVLSTPGVAHASVYSGMDGTTFSNSTSSGQLWAILEPFEEWVGQLKTRSVSGAMVPINAIATLAAMARIAREVLPAGRFFEWTDLAYQQRTSGDAGALAFVLGVGVFFGMIGVTVFGLVFTPLFYVLCRKLAGRFAPVPRVRVAQPSGPAGTPSLSPAVRPS